MRILIVGPCASGKTTLERGLCQMGYDAHSAAQEHSYVPTMWCRVHKPDVLIYLDANLATVRERSGSHWEPRELERLKDRLSHARAHCDLYVCTDDLTEEEVLESAWRFLEERRSI